ncbi:MAG: hypothetical protein M1822_002730 [Bathelium mastoideum]|nr:MAG: hypothetical protein M1822_002730 [Bathelium mastoideum]
MAPNLSWIERNRRKAAGECFRCGAYGHMACHKDVCPAWAFQEERKAEEMREKMREKALKEARKAIGIKKPASMPWGEWRHLMKHELCFRCKEPGHKSFHDALCPAQMPNRWAVDYTKIELRRMTISFLDFPREVRDMIYDSAGDWNDAIRLYRDGVDKRDSLIETQWRKYFGTFFPLEQKLSTPTILLLSRQIYFEMREMLHTKPLQLSSKQSEITALRAATLNWDLRKLVSLPTFANMKTIHFHADREYFKYGVDAVQDLDTALFRSSPTQSRPVEHVLLTVYGENPSHNLEWHDSEKWQLGQVKILRCIKKVTVQGNGLPSKLGHGMSFYPKCIALEEWVGWVPPHVPALTNTLDDFDVLNSWIGQP